jgi:hypothetical protein
MASANEQFLQEMLDDLFEKLQTNTAVASLGWGTGSAKVFALYDGRKLPVLSNGTLNATDLPALYVPTLTPSPVEDDRTPTFEVIQIEVPLSVAFANSEIHKSNSAVQAMAAMMTIQDALLTRTNLASGLGPNIHEFDSEIGELNGITSDDNPGKVLYWSGEVIVRIRRQRDLPA